MYRFHIFQLFTRWRNNCQIFKRKSHSVTTQSISKSEFVIFVKSSIVAFKLSSEIKKSLRIIVILTKE